MPKSRPLEGVRVLDFTWVRAGPWATRWLGAFGAEVIKVEWPLNPDPLRRPRPATTPPDIEPGLNTSGQFADTNVNKRSITLNARTPRGMEMVRDFVSISDIVIENFSAGVIKRWGIGYDEMQKLKPDIIYVSMAGFGQTGRHASYTTMGPSAQALSGLTFLSGLPDKPPAGWGWSYLDDSGGMYGAMSALTALRHRSVTGEGQHVDLSQMTVGITLTGASFLDKTINNRSARREGFPPGNRSVWPDTPVMNNYRGPMGAPHNSYRTKGAGYNDWCVIACFSDQEWQNLVELMGSPTWAADEKFGSLNGRIQHQEELDKGIEAWTLTLPKYDLMEKCQAAGVKAMPVQSAQDRVENDPQLKERGAYNEELKHSILGRQKVQNTPFSLSNSSVDVHTVAPLIGEHNTEIATDILGLSRNEIAECYEDGTFWPPDMPMFPYVKEALE